MHPHQFACNSMGITMEIGYMGDIVRYPPISCHTSTGLLKSLVGTL